MRLLFCLDFQEYRTHLIRNRMKVDVFLQKFFWKRTVNEHRLLLRRYKQSCAVIF